MACSLGNVEDCARMLGIGFGGRMGQRGARGLGADGSWACAHFDSLRPRLKIGRAFSARMRKGVWEGRFRACRSLEFGLRPRLSIEARLQRGRCTRYERVQCPGKTVDCARMLRLGFRGRIRPRARVREVANAGTKVPAYLKPISDSKLIHDPKPTHGQRPHTPASSRCSDPSLRHEYAPATSAAFDTVEIADDRPPSGEG